MKKIILASALLVFAACNKPAERVAIVNPKDAEKIVAIKDIAELTSEKKLILTSSGSNADVSKLAPSLKQAKIEGKADLILKKVKTEALKASLEAQLKSGAVALVILPKEIKIFKMLADATATPAPAPAPQATDTKPTVAAGAEIAEAAPESAPEAILEVAGPNQELLTMKYLNKLKEHSRSSDARAQAAMEGELAQAKAERPSQIGESFGFVEIASIEVLKVGILDNERTDYGEKKSLLNVIDTSFELATHLQIGEEKKAKTTGEGSEEAAE